MKNSQLISVVTPSRNQARFIGEALESVQSQNYANWEHLLMDGASTDDTVNILRANADANEKSHIVWVSEPDNGQSEALNKGFRRAKGDIVGWLNSDDRYRAGCFEHVIKAFEANPEIDIIYGDYMLVDESGAALRTRREIEFNEFILRYHHVLYIPTTATFFRRRIFDEDNWLDENLQYAMDLEFFIRLAARGYRFKHIPEVLADFRLQPDSKTCSYPDKQRMEHRQILLATMPGFGCLKSLQIRKAALFLLWSIACFRRYSEKLRRGYYWEKLRANDSSLIGM